MKLFLFDLDGTLVNTGGAGLKALEQTFQTVYGIYDALKDFSCSGKTDPAIFRQLARTHIDKELSSPELEYLQHTYLRYLSINIRYSKNYRVLPGVERFFELLMLRGDILLGLGTGNLESGARIKLTRSNLSPYLPFGGFGSDAEERPEILKVGHRRAEARCGRKIPEKSVFIFGDTRLDIEAAKMAGYQSVAVGTGEFSHEDLKASGPDYFLPDLTHGPGFLRSLDSVFPPVEA